MNHKSSDGLCKFSLLPCTKGKVTALISPVLRGQSSSLQVHGAREPILDGVCGQEPLASCKRSVKIESSHC